MKRCRVTFDGELLCGFDDRFLGIKESIEGMSALSADRLWTIYNAAMASLGVEGVFVECGVDRGGSAKFIAETIKGFGRKLHLFDTFSGMPQTSDLDYHKQGDFPPVGIETVKGYVASEDAIFHAGVVEETLQELGDEKVAFAHLDCDLYGATRACCEQIYPRLSPRGVMIFDDYGRLTTQGVHTAVDEYFRGRGALMVNDLVAAQMVVVK